MTAITSSFLAGRDYRKWALFAVMGVLAVLAICADESFLINAKDPEWAHIQPFKWLLLVHGLAGATALLIGPFQFSTSFRRDHLQLHRIMGRIYIGAIFIAGPLSIYIGGKWDKPPLNLEPWAQGGVWMISAGLALVYAMKRNLVLHKQWIARSYGITFAFVVSRVPDFFHFSWGSTTNFTIFLLFLVIGSIMAADIIIQMDDLLRKPKAAGRK